MENLFGCKQCHTELYSKNKRSIQEKITISHVVGFSLARLIKPSPRILQNILLVVFCCYTLSSHADIFTGDDTNNNFHGYDGNDALYGGNGDDQITGGAGRDTTMDENSRGKLLESIVKVDEVLQKNAKPLNQVKASIRKTLAMAQLKETVRTLSETVKQQASVTIH
ncbi:MAG: hypothetical protein GY770_31390 [Aestuariibacter sp.]|nr:hypothetical protein [Aestuariibacter sp.]